MSRKSVAIWNVSRKRSAQPQPGVRLHRAKNELFPTGTGSYERDHSSGPDYRALEDIARVVDVDANSREVNRDQHVKTIPDTNTPIYAADARDDGENSAA